MTVQLSIVIPTRNRPDDLKNCLHALVNQDDKSLSIQVIVVDDHSDNQALQENIEITQGINLNLIEFIQLPDSQRGAVFARNLGLKHSKGQIIGFLDDDSIPALNWVSTVLRYFSESSEVNAITGWVEAVDLNHPLSIFRQNFYNQRYAKLMTSKTTLFIKDKYKLEYQGNYTLADTLAGGNSAVRATAVNSIQGFDSNFQMMHDKELAIRLLIAGKICIFAPDLRVRHVHTKSAYDALTKSFVSGKFAFKLQQKYGNTSNRLVVSPLRPYTTIRNADFSNYPSLYSLLFVFIAIVILEYAHQTGYVLEWFRVRLRSA